MLGGDGTMLNSSRRLAEYSVPWWASTRAGWDFTDVARDDVLLRIGEILDGRFPARIAPCSKPKCFAVVAGCFTPSPSMTWSSIRASLAG